MSVPDTFKEEVDANGYNHFGGYIIWYKDYVGNSARNKTGRGQMFNGAFHMQQGRISFQANLWVDISEGQTVFKYGGVVNALFPTTGSIRGMYASMGGSFFEINGKGANTWYSPVDDNAPPAFCREADLAFLPPPAPPPVSQLIPPASTTPLSAVPPPVVPVVPVLNRMPTVPSPAVGVSFTGNWVTFVRNGVVYNLTMSQAAAGRVSGDYTFGKLSNGVVVGRDLYAVWTQGSATGTVMFHMAPDSTSFAGMWAQAGIGVKPTSDNAKGSWDGYSSNVFTKARQTGEFAGRFELNRDGAKLPLDLALDGDRVSGSYAGGTLSGTVTRQQGRPTELSMQVAEGSARARASSTSILMAAGSQASGTRASAA